jgi:thiamine pyrophosphate-dependent acetolactate synthase large subunit-like protein
MPLQEVTAQDDRQLQDMADRLAKSHKILVITGAGISTSCGIPVRLQNFLSILI